MLQTAPIVPIRAQISAMFSERFSLILLQGC
jgi:hypothetical protein